MNPILARPQRFALHGPPGALEEILLETQALLAEPWKPHKFSAQASLAHGVVRLHASWDQACELCSRLSTAHDLRLELPTAKVAGWDDLPQVLASLPWTDLLPSAAPVFLHTEAGQGTLGHAGKLRRLIADFFETRGHQISDQPTPPATRMDFSSHAQFLRTQVSLGPELHKRGWRASTGTLASLREDLAAAALQRSAKAVAGAKATRILVPFAGSGTLGFEAWHALWGLPPAIWGATRAWQHLTHPSPQALAWWHKRTLRAAQMPLPTICFVERDPRAVRELAANIGHVCAALKALGLPLPKLELLEADIFEVPDKTLFSPDEDVLLPLHPPYGLRLQGQDTLGLYRRLGQTVQRWNGRSASLQGFCLCPDQASWRAFQTQLGLPSSTSHITQGGLDVRLCAFGARPEA